jgi:uncharacterized protein YheU (UPF0270 family)
MSDDAEAAPIVLTPDQLSPEALRGLVEEFVTRDGTDYGAVERSVDEKAARLEAQLRSGEALVVFDPHSETANIVLARDLEAGADPGAG